MSPTSPFSPISHQFPFSPMPFPRPHFPMSRQFLSLQLIASTISSVLSVFFRPITLVFHVLFNCLDHMSRYLFSLSSPVKTPKFPVFSFLRVLCLLLQSWQIPKFPMSSLCHRAPLVPSDPSLMTPSFLYSRQSAQPRVPRVLVSPVYCTSSLHSAIHLTNLLIIVGSLS